MCPEQNAKKEAVKLEKKSVGDVRVTQTEPIKLDLPPKPIPKDEKTS